MYTNIDTDHALVVIGKFLRDLPIYERRDLDIPTVMAALSIIMRYNYFRFGDTYFQQVFGTAMGAPPACVYAILSFGVHEHALVPQFADRIPFYKRYIDDGFGVWIHHHDQSTDDKRWKQFQTGMNSFGKLRWTFSSRTRAIAFLDLFIFHDLATKIQTRLFEKEMNLYLYLPPHSSHPPGIYKGFIRGMIYRILRLTTRLQDKQASLQALYNRLIKRGYNRDWLHDFIKQSTSIIEKRLAAPRPVKSIDDELAENCFNPILACSFTCPFILRGLHVSKFSNSFENIFCTRKMSLHHLQNFKIMRELNSALISLLLHTHALQTYARWSFHGVYAPLTLLLPQGSCESFFGCAS